MFIHSCCCCRIYSNILLFLVKRVLDWTDHTVSFSHVKLSVLNHVVNMLLCHRAVAELYGAGLAIAGSQVRIPPMAAVYQCQLSVPSLWGRLMSTSESWRVNGHTTRCTSLVSMVLWLRLVSGWGLWNGDQRHPMGLKARERTLLYFFTLSQPCFPNHHETFLYS